MPDGKKSVGISFARAGFRGGGPVRPRLRSRRVRARRVRVRARARRRYRRRGRAGGVRSREGRADRTSVRLAVGRLVTRRRLCH